MEKFKVIINTTKHGEYEDTEITCDYCKQPRSVAIVSNYRICLDCLETARVCIFRELGRKYGIGCDIPPYKETPTCGTEIKKENTNV